MQEKEYLVKVSKDVEKARELLCDYCGVPLTSDFFAKIYEDPRGRIYLEDYVCEKCRKGTFGSFEEVALEDCRKEVKDRIEENLKNPAHGYMVFTNNPEEIRLLIENPFLIQLWGEEF